MQPQVSYFLAEDLGPTCRRGPRKPAAIRFYRPRVEQLEDRTLMAGVAWGGHARDPQHTATSPVASQPLEEIAWQTPVDLSPQYTPGSNYLLIHYGSPLVTEANTVIVPVKTGASGGFRVEGRSGANGALKWTQTTDYVLPPHNWVPSYAPTLTPSDRLYFAGAGGTVYYINAPDANGATTSGQFAFFGMANYSDNKSAYDGSVFINTPITSDSAGNIYFGFRVTGANPSNLQSGIARIDPVGNGTWISASAVSGDAAITQVVMNSAPALSHDGQTLYVAVSRGNFGSGYLVALDSQTLGRIGASGTQVRLKDPNGNDALLPDNGSASPTVGPNGDVYFGVFESPLGYNHYRGWLLHFSGDLSQSYAPGAFGWDDTASVVPATMVPTYSGTSSYLLMTKYNNYPGVGGDGVHRLAIVDPTESMTDPISGQTVMKEVLTIAGVTPDHEYVGSFPNAVREWCTNTSVVDPSTGSVLANSADGKLYRWDLSTNTLSEQITLTQGIGEAYTPTIIGVDGTVYAINNATLFAVRQAAAVTADDQSISLREDATAAISLRGQGEGSLPMTFSVEDEPANGTLSGTAPNLTYVPFPGFNGSDRFTYRAHQGEEVSRLATVSLTVAPINDAPAFSKGPDVQATDESGPQEIAGWATEVSAGPPNEADQALDFIVQVPLFSLGLFAELPEIDAGGTLTFTPAPNVSGTAFVTVALNDDGGTVDGGVDISLAQTFQIVIDKPRPRHNVVNPLDVTGAESFPGDGNVPGNGTVFADDVLLVINFLNAFGPGAVQEGDFGPPYYDVTGDNHNACDDALTIINYLNSSGAGPRGPAGEMNGTQATGDADVLALLAMELAMQSRRRR